ncbi:MAG: nuclear transport factor 2 family protein [Alphaproteobacteria bacterium]|nr:nuclear transport factor 2 family protein [Alphaproteobacteria bacterium]
MADPTPAQRIDQVIRTYIQACNDADATAIAACFCPDAVHYGPAAPKWSGAATIGGNFADRVRKRGVCWTVDQLLVDVERCAAALEWTRFDRNGRIVRGVDWFVFEPQTVRIREVRPYFAVAPNPELPRQELQDFDYAGRGYATNAPR